MWKAKSDPPSTGPFLSYVHGPGISGPCAVPDAGLNSIIAISPEQTQTSSGIRWSIIESERVRAQESTCVRERKSV